MADVKFSELASLAAADVASADVLAIVDTDAATSKKLSIDALFGSIPVNVLQTDTTDATSSSGAVRTAGGVSMAKKLYVGTTSTLTGAVTATAGVFPATQDGAPLGSSSLQFSDLFLADAGVVAFGDDGEVTLTHVHDSGLLLSDASGVGVTKLMFGDAACFVQQSTDGQLDIDGDAEIEITSPIVDINASTGIALDGANLNSAWTVNLANKIQLRDTGIFIHSSVDGQADIEADGELEITSPIVDIDASTGIALDGANLNSAWTVNTTNKIQFHDAAQYIHAPADTRLAVVSDGPVELTSTMVKVGLASQDGNVQALTDVFDMTLSQFDGFEVARITDGAKAVPTGFAAVQTAKGGFGFRRMVISHTQANTTTSTLTLAQSGAIVQLIGSGTGYADLITLPAVVAADVGCFFDFVVTTVFHASDSCKVLTETAAAAGSQGFCLDAFNAAGGSGDEHTRTAFSAGATDFLTIPASTPVGTTVRVEAVVGGSGTMWMAKSYTTGVTVAAAAT